MKYGDPLDDQHFDLCLAFFDSEFQFVFSKLNFEFEDGLVNLQNGKQGGGGCFPCSLIKVYSLNDQHFDLCQHSLILSFSLFFQNVNLEF